LEALYSLQILKTKMRRIRIILRRGKGKISKENGLIASSWSSMKRK